MSAPTQMLSPQSDDRILGRAALARVYVVLSWVTAAWALLLAGICLARNGHYVYDDTFITLRYARHLVEGYGPVWNLHGDRVEGFSSPVHLLLIAALGRLGVPLLLAARVIGYTSHAALAGFVLLWMKRRSGLYPAVLAAALVVSSWPILVWDAGGLDAVLFAAVAGAGTLVTLSYLENGSRARLLTGGGLLGLAAFIRPDGAVFAGASLLACLVLGRAEIRNRIRDILLAGCLVVAINIPWEIFRVLYYHQLLANTYYAKIAGIPVGWRIASGIAYWRAYAREAPFLALLLFFAALVVVLRHRWARLDVGLWAVIVAYAAYVVYSGGDHMMAFRFMVPLIPILAVALIRALVADGMTSHTATAAITTAVLAVVSARQVSPTVENPVSPDWAGQMGEVIGHYISSHWSPGSLIAVNVAGTTAFFADQMDFIDMLGLNDRAIGTRANIPMNLPTVKLIGHLKGDGASVFRRRPQYIIPRGGDGPFPTLADTNDSLTEYELIRQPGFTATYEQCEIILDVPPDRPPHTPGSFAFDYYQRRDVNTPCVAPK